MNRISLAALALIPLVTAGCPECPGGDCGEPEAQLRLADGRYDLTLGQILDNSCELVELEEGRLSVPALYTSRSDGFVLEVEGMVIRGEVSDGWIGGSGSVVYDEGRPEEVETGVAVEDDEGAPPPCEVVDGGDREDERDDSDERREDGAWVAIDMEVLSRSEAGGVFSFQLSERDFGEDCAITWDARLDAADRAQGDDRGDDDRPVSSDDEPDEDVPGEG